mgnify:FL=1
MVAEDPAHFWHKELEYANSRPELRNFVLPVAVEVGLRPSELALPGSFDKSRETQLTMIEAYSQELQKQFPNIPNIRAIMLPSTGYAQADRAYKAQTGEVLFRNYSARALDNLSGVAPAFVGRDLPGGRLYVNGWAVVSDSGIVGGVPAVVFVGNR